MYFKSKRKKESPRSKIRRKQRKKKVPGQRSEETQKKKESSRSKIKREQKIQKGVWTRQCMNKHAGLSQARKKRKEAMAYDTWGGPLLDYQPKSFVPVTLSPYAKQKQKRKRPKYQSQVSPPKTPLPKKSCWSMIARVIFGLIGNDLQSQVMTYLWFRIRIKHLPVWDLYTLSDFLLFQLDPVFPLNDRLETKF